MDSKSVPGDHLLRFCAECNQVTDHVLTTSGDGSDPIWCCPHHQKHTPGLIAEIGLELEYEDARTPRDKRLVVQRAMDRYPDEVARWEWFQAAVQLGLVPRVEGEGEDRPMMSEQQEKMSEQQEKGKVCCTVVTEMKRIKSFYRQGWSIRDVQKSYPDFSVWEIIRDRLSDDERKVFDHPRQWGAVVGYARGLLAKRFGCSTETIRDWMTAYRKVSKSPVP